MKFDFVMAGMLAASMATSSFAKRPDDFPLHPVDECFVREKYQLDVKFYGFGEDAIAAETGSDAKIRQLVALVDAQHFAGGKLFSSNYTINAYPRDVSPEHYGYNGEAIFSLLPSDKDKALAFVAPLFKKDYQAHVNSDIYVSGDMDKCGQNMRIEK